MNILLDTHLLLWWLSNDPAGQAFESLPQLAAHARHMVSLPWRHRDPFDRMLVAQAISEGLTLLTADQALAAYGSFVEVT